MATVNIHNVVSANIKNDAAYGARWIQIWLEEEAGARHEILIFLADKAVVDLQRLGALILKDVS
jgi:hypothetical protein